MSDVQTAGAAMGVPSELVQRSAAARAAADGTSVDDILAAWAGDAPPPAPAATATAEPEPAVAPAEPEPETHQEQEAAAVAVLEEPVVPVAEPEVGPEAEPEQSLEPVSLGTRVKTALRVGAWTGAALGVVGFLAASAFWAPSTTVGSDMGPVVQISPTNVTIGIALVSVVFGAIVAGMSRAATAWTDPAMQLSGSKSATAWLGAAIGLVLGLAAGGILGGLGMAVEGADPPLTQLPVLATLLVMMIGGAILGAVTAIVPQLFGVPVAVDQLDTEELGVLRKRLRHAMSVPLAGLLILALLVLPFAFTLIESNHLAPGIGGAVVAIIAASGILGFAALAGSRPEMKISFGDFMVALIGIGVVLIIIISVMFATQSDEESVEESDEFAAVVQVI